MKKPDVPPKVYPGELIDMTFELGKLRGWFYSHRLINPLASREAFETLEQEIQAQWQLLKQPNGHKETA